MDLTEMLNALAPDPAGGASLEIPEDWLQGRTVYGGLNAALAAVSARRITPEAGPLRNLQIAFLAPASGTLRYVATPLREGRSVTFVGVDCWAGDTLAGRAVLTFGRARPSDLDHTRLSPPAASGPQGLSELPFVAGAMPAFLTHLELRPASGSAPLSGGEPECAMWVRLREGAELDPEVALLAVADVLPPAVLGALRTMRAASSVTWSIDLATIPPDPSGWYLLSTSSDRAAEGYSAQAMAAFGPDGTLAAVSRQTVATF